MRNSLKQSKIHVSEEAWMFPASIGHICFGFSLNSHLAPPFYPHFEPVIAICQLCCFSQRNTPVLRRATPWACM